jgi:hypothetical protein
MERAALEAEIAALVVAWRTRALWWVREDWMPTTDEERRWALERIARRADRSTWIRTKEIDQWLSARCNEVSVGS